MNNTNVNVSKESAMETLDMCIARLESIKARPASEWNFSWVLEDLMRIQLGQNDLMEIVNCVSEKVEEYKKSSEYDEEMLQEMINQYIEDELPIYIYDIELNGFLYREKLEDVLYELGMDKDSFETQEKRILYAMSEYILQSVL